MKRLLVSMILVGLLVSSVCTAQYRVLAGDTTTKITFPMTQSSDHVSAFTGGTTFSVRYKLGEGSWTAMTTPTVVEDSAANDPGEYTLSLDQSEILVVPAGRDWENLRVDVYHANADTFHGLVTVYEPMSTIPEIQAGLATLANQTTMEGKIDTVDGVADDIKVKTDAIPLLPAAVGDIPTASENAVAMVDLSLTGHDTAGTVGKALIDAAAGGSALTESGIAAAVWGYDVPGALVAGDAGYILGNVVSLGANASAGIEYFFDVVTPAKTMNDVGVAGTGLTAEDVWTYTTRTLTALDEDGTTIDLDSSTLGTVNTLTGHTAQTGDAYARLGTPAGASVSADIAEVKSQAAAIETDTQDLQAQIGTDGAGLTAIGDTRLANLDATVSSRSSHDAAAVKTAMEVDGSMLEHLHEMTQDNGSGTRQLTADAVELAPTGTGSGLTPQQTRDAMKLAPSAGAADAGSIDAQIAAANTTLGSPAGASVSADIAAVKSDAAAAKAAAEKVDTSAELRTLLAGSDTPVATESSQTSIINTLGAAGAGLTGLPPMVLTAAYDAAKTAAPAATALSNVTWTDAKAALLDASIASRLAAAGYTAPDNASIASILTDTGTDIPASIAALNDLSSADAQAAAAAALTAYDVPTEAQMNARTLAAADYFDPATDPITVSVDVDEAAIATALLATQIDGVTLQSLFESQLADLVGKVSVVISGTTRTYTYYKQDGTTVKMIIQATTPTGARTATGQIDPE